MRLGLLPFIQNLPHSPPHSDCSGSEEQPASFSAQSLVMRYSDVIINF